MVQVLERLRQFEQITSSFQPELNRKDNYIGIPTTDGDNICEKLHELGFSNSAYVDGIVQIDLDQPDFALFFDINDFGKRVEPDHHYKNIIILTPIDGHFYCYNPNESHTIIDLQSVDGNYFFENVWQYFTFLDFLKRQDYQENKPFYFVDHYDDSRSQFVFISPKKEGKLVIPFADVKPLFPTNQLLKPRLDNFRSAFEEGNKHLPKFIKYELFNILPKVDRDERMLVLIDKLPDILHIAHQNFEVYLHDLSLDKLKSEYQKSQEEYFTKLRELQGKIMSQTIAFPLSITATAFATFKVTDSKQPALTNVLLFLIIAAFLVFTGFTAYLLKIQKADVDELKNNADRDFEKISKNKFFDNPKNAADKDLFDSMKNKVWVQFRRINTASKTYFYLQLFFNALFINGIIFQITQNIYLAMSAGVASILSLFFVYTYFGKYAK